MQKIEKGEPKPPFLLFASIEALFVTLQRSLKIICYIARVTLPAFMHFVHTRMRFVESPCGTVTV
jgi:hypothetical protein